MNLKQDVLSRYHPAVSFFYFCSVVLFGMLFMHPVLQLFSGLGAFFYASFLSGRRAAAANTGILASIVLISMFVNALFQHRGATVLFYFRENRITMEALLYGVSAGLMIAAMIFWFYCAGKVLSSEKIMYLFGRILPSFSLIFSMILRFLPRFSIQAVRIYEAQKGIGFFGRGRKVESGLKITSVLMTWALENAVDTADSMKARGYGTAKRSIFSRVYFGPQDAGIAVLIFLLVSVIVTGAIRGEISFQYFPMLKETSFAWGRAAVYTAYLLLCFLPLFLNLQEERKWRRLQSKI